jgi:hypothetical protein
MSTNPSDPWTALRFQVSSVFTPAAPVRSADFFSGRIDQLQLIADTMGEPGRHAIIYGERGVGKTSMTNIVGEVFSKWVLRVAADSGDSYASLWHKVFKRINYIHQRPGTGFAGAPTQQAIQLAETVDIDDLGPDTVVNAIGDLVVTIVLDEFDRLQDEQAVALTADTIKTFSDVASDATLVVVGVARDVEELIGHHPSIERNLRQIPMPRMSSTELETILGKGFTTLGMDLPDHVRDRIVALSQGFPHYTHLLGKYSALQAIEAKSLTITVPDFLVAVQTAIDDTAESIRSAYQVATMTTRTETIFPAVLLAAAIAGADEYGTFRATDLVDPICRITGKDYTVPNFTYNLGKLSSTERGSVLEKVGTSQPRYRFTNPLMKPFILMKALDSGALGDDFFEGQAEDKTVAPDPDALAAGNTKS